MATIADPLTTPSEHVFGHPRGLVYLAFTEIWERFSYYGMSALLVLYMTQTLLLPGHAEHVVGLAGFRQSLEAVFGPLPPQAFASQIYGLYTGFVYFMPLIGGWIADRWFGARRVVIAGALLMSAGHFAMAFQASFLFALALLIVGTGFLKGNITAQVGRLYRPDEETLRVRGYTLFSTGINVGAVAGPIACGLLAQLYGWHAGFAAAGTLMLAALVTYLAGQPYLPAERPARQREAAAAARMTAAERRTVALLVATMAITIFQSVCYYQYFNTGLLWVDTHVDLATPWGHFPAAWFHSLDSLVAILVVPLLIGFWGWQSSRGREPGDIGKIGWGAAIQTASALTIAFCAWLAGSGKVAIWLPLIGFSIQGIAFLYYWPTLLALVSQSAPAKVNAMLIGVAFLTMFVTGLLVGWIGTFYGPLGPVRFWLLQAAISATGALLVLVVGRALGRELEPRPA